jgi:hypothetical protein
MKSFKQYIKEDNFTQVANIIINCYKTYNKDGYVQTYIDALNKMKEYGLIADYNIGNKIVTPSTLKKSKQYTFSMVKQFAEETLKHWQDMVDESKGNQWYKLHERGACRDILTILQKRHLIKGFNLHGIIYNENI